MYQQVAKLIIYRNLESNSILSNLATTFQQLENGALSDVEITKQIYAQINNILIVSTEYGFDKNLWQNYLTFMLITSENSFSITCEKVGANNGSVNEFAKNDFKVFMNLFHYDFIQIEKKLGINCFTVITNYTAICKNELMYNKNVSEKVQALSEKLKDAKDENEFFNYVTGFYKDYGVGIFGLNKAFRISSNSDGSIQFHSINNMDRVLLPDLIGYEEQKKKLIENTEAFVQGKKANNALLYGDSGTGKSTSIKAIVNQYYSQGLRMIEIYKHQFKDLSTIISQIKNRNYKFIIYMDDLSFEEFEIEYKFLKAVIEGGVETKPDNILIYATSNRRHIIKETWNDRSDMESVNGIHRSDSIEEKLSLVNRFGCRIYYAKPTRKEFHNIVLKLADKYGINIDEEVLFSEANRWEMSNGGTSGRTAQQFINYYLGK